MGTVSNSLPTLALNRVVTQLGLFPNAGGGSDGSVIGAIHTYAFSSFGSSGDTNGQLIAINSNSALFSILGTTYGGDGRTTFGLPDLEEKLAVGIGQGPGLTNHNQGGEFGSNDINLTEANTPASLGGGGQSFDNAQESLPIVYAIKTQGFFPSTDGGSGSSYNLLGTVQAFALTPGSLPGDWVQANGQLLSIASNTALFSILGTTYGGDGRTTFGLPDLRGRTIVGAGDPPGAAPNIQLGEKSGSETVTLSPSQLPSSIGGGDAAFDNTQPTLALNYLIALDGLYPSRDRLETNDADVPYIGEVIPFAGNFAPRGFAFAHGQLLDISSNQTLFSLLGTQFGGDGRTTFALPDLRGRAIIDESSSRSVGSIAGENSTVILATDIADFAGAARDDDFFTDDATNVSGTADVHADNGNGADTDSNSPLTVTHVNDAPLSSGAVIDLPSGAKLTMNSDGTFTYDLNGAFTYLTAGAVTTDSFTYKNGISTTATVTINITGVDNDDTLDGVVLMGEIDGGVGSNAVTYENSTGSVTASLADPSSNSGDAAGDTYVNIQNLTGTPFADHLTGDSGDNVLKGLGGNDILDGGDGVDTVDYSEAMGPVNVRLDRDSATGEGDDTLLNIENVIGSQFADKIYGSNATNVTNRIEAGDGDDKVYGRNSVDIIDGGDGADLLFGYGGMDEMYGGDGNDRMYGMFSNDVLYGGAGNDLVVGDAANDILYGNGDNDRLFGGTGDDILDGGDGADFHDGSSGNDIFKSSAGADRLVGRGDFDTFEFEQGNENDRIFGFENDIDDIKISTNFGFSSVSELLNNHTRAVGNTLYIDLDLPAGDHVQLVNWLSTNTVNDLLDDISFF